MSGYILQYPHPSHSAADAGARLALRRGGRVQQPNHKVMVLVMVMVVVVVVMVMAVMVVVVVVVVVVMVMVVVATWSTSWRYIGSCGNGHCRRTMPDTADNQAQRPALARGWCCCSVARAPDVGNCPQ